MRKAQRFIGKVKEYITEVKYIKLESFSTESYKVSKSLVQGTGLKKFWAMPVSVFATKTTENYQVWAYFTCPDLKMF